MALKNFLGSTSGGSYSGSGGRVPVAVEYAKRRAMMSRRSGMYGGGMVPQPHEPREDDDLKGPVSGGAADPEMRDISLEHLDAMPEPDLMGKDRDETPPAPYEEPGMISHREPTDTDDLRGAAWYNPVHAMNETDYEKFSDTEDVNPDRDMLVEDDDSRKSPAKSFVQALKSRVFSRRSF